LDLQACITVSTDRSSSEIYVIHPKVHIKDVCVFTAPIFSGFTAIATYLLTTELWSPGAGLFAAAFISIAPGYISRSVAGSYDNEGIAILHFNLLIFFGSGNHGQKIEFN